MEITTALTLDIGQRKQPVVTGYQLGCLVFQLYREKTFRGEALSRLQKDLPDRAILTRLIGILVSQGVLQNTRDIPNKDIYAVLGQSNADAEDIVCCIDPFCYLSHISAMVYHGFTDRLPKILTFTSPPPKLWAQLAEQRMIKDIGQDTINQYREAGLPPLHRLRLAKVHRKTLSTYSTKQYDSGAYLAIQGRSLRVASIGRTFLDMIREPDLCGGIYHVLDVYQQHAPSYLRQIVEVIDRHGKKIDKVRVGYILDERLGLSHPIIETWRSLVQRGGSQKLQSKGAYSGHFSEKWCLSLNIDEEEDV